VFAVPVVALMFVVPVVDPLDLRARNRQVINGKKCDLGLMKPNCAAPVASFDDIGALTGNTASAKQNH
jgi:hypothetical protein